MKTLMATLAALSLAGTVQAATIMTVGSQASGVAFGGLIGTTGSEIATDVGTFRALDDRSGRGLRVHSSPDYGWIDRGPEAGNLGAVDSRWSNGISWTANAPKVRFSVLDAFDRRTTSSMRLVVGDAVYDFQPRASGNWHHFLVDFAGGDRTISFLREAKDGVGPCEPGGYRSTTCDGWAITHVAPIPLPAAGWMSVAGLAALFGLGRRRAGWNPLAGLRRGGRAA